MGNGSLLVKIDKMQPSSWNLLLYEKYCMKYIILEPGRTKLINCFHKCAREFANYGQFVAVFHRDLNPTSNLNNHAVRAILPLCFMPKIPRFKKLPKRRGVRHEQIL